MLSILIPTYNYNALPLATELEKQALALQMPFELICIDDGSFSELNKQNQQINTLTNSRFLENKKNIGRVANRKLLAEKAQYKWLLFVDVDLWPSHDNFIKNLVEHIKNETDVLFGGISYSKKAPLPSHQLRWHYGKSREQVAIAKRVLKPYSSIILGSFTIKKQLFLKIVGSISLDGYGLDILFTYKLKQEKAVVAHIENSMVHLGLDSNEVYLKKTKEALHSLHTLNAKKLITTNYSGLLKAYTLIKRLGLKSFLANLWQKKGARWEASLSQRPNNLRLFDFYRLAHLCSIKS